MISPLLSKEMSRQKTGTLPTFKLYENKCDQDAIGFGFTSDWSTGEMSFSRVFLEKS